MSEEKFTDAAELAHAEHGEFAGSPALWSKGARRIRGAAECRRSRKRAAGVAAGASAVTCSSGRATQVTAADAQDLAG
jgi:hypothetical protein